VFLQLGADRDRCLHGFAVFSTPKISGAINRPDTESVRATQTWLVMETTARGQERVRILTQSRAWALVADDYDQAQRQYVVARHAEVVARHSAQAARVHDLTNLLGSALVRTERFDLAALRKDPQCSEFEPGVAGLSLVPPVWADFAPDETPGRQPPRCRTGRVDVRVGGGSGHLAHRP